MHYRLSDAESHSNLKASVNNKLFVNIGRRRTLSELVKSVTSCSCAYEDVAEQIEDRAYEECEKGRLEQALKKLTRISDFFENLKNKNEEIIRDLADVYTLVGQMHQYTDYLEESIDWFAKAIIVDDQYPVPYHSCAISNLKLGRSQDAIRCLEQEIILAPGNYYSYLMLSDIYKQQNMGKQVESTLKKLLQRDPNNIQGLHRLIQYYEEMAPAADVELLRRHLLNSKCQFNRIEAIIRSYHLICEKRYQEVIEFIDNWHRSATEVTVVHLIKAHVFGVLRHYTQKRLELAKFKERNHGREEIMLPKLHEFGLIFGKNAEKRLTHRLKFTFPEPQ